MATLTLIRAASRRSRGVITCLCRTLNTASDTAQARDSSHSGGSAADVKSSAWIEKEESATYQELQKAVLTLGPRGDPNTIAEEGVPRSSKERQRKIRPIEVWLEDENATGLSIEQRQVSLVKVFRELGRGRRWKQALEILKKAERSSLPLNEVVYHTAMAVCAKTGQSLEAQRLLQRMKKKGLGPGQMAYGIAISACARGQHMGRGLRLLSEMKDAGKIPSPVTYAAAIAACSRCNSARRALELLDEMREHDLEPNAVTWSCVMHACARRGLGGQSLSLLEEMKARGVEPNGFNYTAAVVACGKEGLWVEGSRLISTMEREGMYPGVAAYNAILHSAGLAGEWQLSLELFEKMKRTKRRNAAPDVVTYNSLLQALHRAGNDYEVSKLLEEMQLRKIPLMKRKKPSAEGTRSTVRGPRNSSGTHYYNDRGPRHPGYNDSGNYEKYEKNYAEEHSAEQNSAERFGENPGTVQKYEQKYERGGMEAPEKPKRKPVTDGRFWANAKGRRQREQPL